MLVVLAGAYAQAPTVPLLLDVRGTRENHVPDAKEICRMHDKVVAAWGQRNLWIEETTDVSATTCDQTLWRLLEDEASRLTPANGELEAATPEAFYGVIAELQVGLRKVALRTDLLRRYLREGEKELPETDAVYEGLRSSGAAESAWSRIVRFLQALARANGTINPRDRTNTQRRSLWRGVNPEDRRGRRRPRGGYIDWISRPGNAGDHLRGLQLTSGTGYSCMHSNRL